MPGSVGQAAACPRFISFHTPGFLVKADWIIESDEGGLQAVHKYACVPRAQHRSLCCHKRRDVVFLPMYDYRYTCRPRGERSSDRQGLGAPGLRVSGLSAVYASVANTRLLLAH